MTIDEITKDEWIMIYENLEGDGHLSDEGIRLLKHMKK